MKLSTYMNNTRDGQLVVVDKALSSAVLATHIAPTLQYALDNWSDVQPHLAKLYQQLNDSPDTLESFEFTQDKCHSPLPRAFQWADGSAYVNHIELVRKARGAEMPENFWHDPLMYQGGSDAFLPPKSDIIVADESYGIDFEAEIAVITDDVPMAIDKYNSAQHIKLLMLVNDVSLRALIPNELGKGFGFFHSKPSSAFSPVAVTPDELGKSWQDSKVHLPLTSYINHKLFGCPNAGVDMTFDFSELIAHAALTRPLSAGTIVGSGTVSNNDRSSGSSCIAEKRMLETIEHGKPTTSFLKFGDTIKIEMLDESGKCIFGSIEQAISPLNYQPT